jgi:hypothetical protein
MEISQNKENKETAIRNSCLFFSIEIYRKIISFSIKNTTLNGLSNTNKGNNIVSNVKSLTEKTRINANRINHTNGFIKLYVSSLVI